MAEPVPLKYRAFISYSHADMASAKWLHRALESFSIDKDLVGRATTTGTIPKALRPIFRDRDDFTAGHVLSEQTLAAIDASHALIAICSPSSAKSHYVNEEIRLFKSRHPQRPVMPLIVDGKPGDPELECFPPLLRCKLDDDGQITNEPLEVLAADAREEGDGKALALAKVVAGLLGVSSDDIFRRAERERRRKGRLHTGIVVVIAALFVGGGFFAWEARERQRTLTEVEAIVAKYAPIGSAEAATPGAKESLTEAITAIAEGKATDQRYAKALELLKVGKPAEAEPLLQAVAEEKSARVKKDTKDAVAAFRNLGIIVGFSDLERAKAAFAKALELDPQDRESLLELGQINLIERDLGLAEQRLTKALEIATATSDQSGLHVAHYFLGLLMLDKGDLAAAMHHEKNAVAIAQNELSLQPDNLNWQDSLASSYNSLGSVLETKGDLEDALNAYQEALAITEPLAKRIGSARQHSLSMSYQRIGGVLKAQGNFAKAERYYRDALVISKQVAKADPHQRMWGFQLALIYKELVKINTQQGKPAGEFDAEMSELKQVYDGQPNQAIRQEP